VRKTLRAPPGKVGVEWAGLQAALAQLEREGFLRGPVTAELHDVLLYSPGDYYKPHTDTKKGPKHLMTLAVDTGLCPPCRGGELVLGTDKDGGEEWLPRGAGSFCAWYTNVVHEVMPLLSGNRCVAVYNVSAEAAHTDQIEKNKLDSIVDALKQLLLIKSKSILENSTKTHIGFSLNGRYSSFAMDNVKVVSRSNLFGADEVLLKALEYGFGVPKEDLQVLVAVKFDDYTADFFENVNAMPRFKNLPSVHFLPMVGRNTCWWSPPRDIVRKRRTPIRKGVHCLHFTQRRRAEVCVQLQLPACVPRKYFSQTERSGTERPPKGRALREERRGGPTWQQDGWTTGGKVQA
jgi:hypothetical protein